MTVIIALMYENYVFKIYTDHEIDLQKVEDIEIINPIGY